MAMEFGQQWRRAALAALTVALLAAFLPSSSSSSDQRVKVCIVGSGMAGASAAHFLRNYSELEQGQLELDVYERHGVVGGRMAMVDLLGDRFEAGASILHPKNLHAVRFVQLLGLKRKVDSDSEGFGIWDGNNFVFRTIDPGKSFIYQKIASWINSLSLLWRYGKSLFTMQAVVARLLERFLHLYEEDRAPYVTVKDLLDSVDLYAYTQHSLDAELLREGLSSRLITELVTVITRINYGQNVTMSGLAGVVALCGSGDNLWAVKGGNWQMADGLVKRSNVSLHLNETVASVTSKNGVYEVATLSGKVKQYDAVVIATPLDESKISFSPSVNLPKRSMHHTFATFVRGLINPAYFGLKDAASVPDLVATLEIPGLPFISISVLKKYNETDKAYKIFSRAALSDDYLDQVFSVRNKTIQIDWAAYPEFQVPEVFAPILLDENHLYYINSFENAASTMETSAVAAENVVRLLLTRLSKTSVMKKPEAFDSFINLRPGICLRCLITVKQHAACKMHRFCSRPRLEWLQELQITVLSSLGMQMQYLESKNYNKHLQRNSAVASTPGSTANASSLMSAFANSVSSLRSLNLQKSSLTMIYIEPWGLDGHESPWICLARLWQTSAALLSALRVWLKNLGGVLCRMVGSAA